MCGCVEVGLWNIDAVTHTKFIHSSVHELIEFILLQISLAEVVRRNNTRC